MPIHNRFRNVKKRYQARVEVMVDQELETQEGCLI